MRSIYHQYTQPENRLTHALACTLAHDSTLIRPFLRWVGVKEVPNAKSLRIVEQQVPGEAMSGDEAESAGLPDMCIFEDEGEWAVLFEAKVQSHIKIDQLRRHRRTAERHGFVPSAIVILSVESLPENSIHDVPVHSIEWRSLWSWFRRRSDRSLWARELVRYMQAFENEMIAKEYAIRGTITMFDGLHFDDDNPYNYREARRLIRLLGDRLQQNKRLLNTLNIDPNGSRRPAITGRGHSYVWDFLPLQAAKGAKLFTEYPHLTMSINAGFASASITVPNGVKSSIRKRLRNCDRDSFSALLVEIQRSLAPLLKKSKGSRVIAYALQRHYRSQRSLGIEDGRIRADLRTLVKGKSKDGVKYQPQWIDAIHALLANKKSNIQFGVSVEFSYDCPIVRSAKATDLFIEAWLGMNPLLEFILDDA